MTQFTCIIWMVCYFIFSFQNYKFVFSVIGGTCGQLLEQNAQALDQISSNFAAFKVLAASYTYFFDYKGLKDGNYLIGPCVF